MTRLARSMGVNQSATAQLRMVTSSVPPEPLIQMIYCRAGQLDPSAGPNSFRPQTYNQVCECDDSKSGEVSSEHTAVKHGGRGLMMWACSAED